MTDGGRVACVAALTVWLLETMRPLCQSNGAPLCTPGDGEVAHQMQQPEAARIVFMEFLASLCDRRAAELALAAAPALGVALQRNVA